MLAGAPRPCVILTLMSSVDSAQWPRYKKTKVPHELFFLELINHQSEQLPQLYTLRVNRTREATGPSGFTSKGVSEATSEGVEQIVSTQFDYFCCALCPTSQEKPR